MQSPLGPAHRRQLAVRAAVCALAGCYRALLAAQNPLLCLPVPVLANTMSLALRAPCAPLTRTSTVSQTRQQRGSVVAVRAQQVEAQGPSAGAAVLEQPARQPSPAVNVIQPISRWALSPPPPCGRHVCRADRPPPPPPPDWFGRPLHTQQLPRQARTGAICATLAGRQQPVRPRPHRSPCSSCPRRSRRSPSLQVARGHSSRDGRTLHALRRCG